MTDRPVLPETGQRTSALGGWYIRPRFPDWHQVELQSELVNANYLSGKITLAETVAHRNTAVRHNVRTDE